jgi:hypothetical protein
MARPRKRRRRGRTVAPPPAPAAAAPGAEECLLGLARELAEISRGASDAEGALAAAVEHLARAWLPEAPLPAVVFDAWRAARADPSRALSLAFAREQIMLALQDTLAATRKTGHPRDDIGPDALAWLVAAGCESLAHGGDSAERIRLLMALCAPAASRSGP